MALFAPDQARRFLSEHWQRAPLFLQAGVSTLPGTPPWRALAADPDVESRRVRTVAAGRYALEHGPFTGADPDEPWTVLISDAQHHAPALAALLDLVDFLPRWRLDDVMMSVACDGASVGPHVDAYDVFLIQAEGVRRWTLGEPGAWQADPDGAELRLVQPFPAAHRYEAHPGDVLYLPPDVPHHGVAAGPCTTYSVGLRAPRLVDLAAVLLEEAPGTPRLCDAGRRPAVDRGALDRQTLSALTAQLEQFLALDEGAVARALGRLVSEPKEWLLEAPGDEVPDVAAVAAALAAGDLGVHVARGARVTMAPDTEPPYLFANGECHALAATHVAYAQALCASGHARIPRGTAARELCELLCRLREDGAVYFTDEA